MTNFLLRLLAPVAFAQTTQLVYKFPGLKQTVSGPEEYVKIIFQFGLGIVGLIALGLIVFGGVEYIVYSGNPSRLADAKDRIISALIGMVLLFSAFIILNEINPKLTDLQNPNLKDVNPSIGIDLDRIKILEDELKIASSTAEVTAVVDKIQTGKDASGNVVANTEQTASDYANGFGAMTPEQFRAFAQDPDKAKINSVVKNLAIYNIDMHMQTMSGEEFTTLVANTPNKTVNQLDNFTNLPTGASVQVQSYVVNQGTDEQKAAAWIAYGDPKNGGGPQGQYQLTKEMTDYSLVGTYNQLDSQQQQTFLNNVTHYTAETLHDPRESMRIIINIWQSLPDSQQKAAFVQQVKAANPSFVSSGNHFIFPY